MRPARVLLRRPARAGLSSGRQPCPFWRFVDSLFGARYESPMRRTSALVGLTFAVFALGATGGSSGSSGALRGAQVKQAQRLYSAVYVGGTGYRYRITIRMASPPIVPRLLGPPGLEYVIADPRTFSVSVTNLTPGRQAPLLGQGGAVGALYSIPLSLQRGLDDAARNQLRAGSFADLSAVLRPQENGYPQGGPIYLRPGGSVTLKGAPIVRGGNDYLLPGRIGTWRLPTRLARGWRAIMRSRPPNYLILWNPAGGGFLDAPSDGATCCDCQDVLLLFNNHKQALPLRARKSLCVFAGQLKPFG